MGLQAVDERAGGTGRMKKRGVIRALFLGLYQISRYVTLEI
ncbi:Hypothetical protein NGK_1369 [Neisseria gonorrhoeae NCCP11945]|uniref:Uncharacterized protein n=1 Tax=Neisseria gonorrhoeae (strain NCCP11945) TaxID=521006 RepID=B4RMK9_NEIG2|nr:Hypothetical protein NGK_1369 [Neisseria gonorrhoeae NCCP11945]